LVFLMILFTAEPWKWPIFNLLLDLAKLY
jgi:hypothetical protein